MKIYDTLEQGTPEWNAIRAGKFTASVDFQQLVTGRDDTKKKLIRKKVAEYITGQPVLNEYTNGNIQRGKELEAQAREAFEMATGLAVRQVGFIEGSEWHGASPDGLIGEDGGIEIKSRDVHTHLDCFLDGFDKSYQWQIQGNLWVSERKLWYFVSYNPHYARFNKHLFIQKIQRDEVAISQIKAAVEIAVKQVKTLAEIVTR